MSFQLNRYLRNQKEGQNIRAFITISEKNINKIKVEPVSPS